MCALIQKELISISSNYSIEDSIKILKSNFITGVVNHIFSKRDVIICSIQSDSVILTVNPEWGGPILRGRFTQMGKGVVFQGRYDFDLRACGIIIVISALLIVCVISFSEFIIPALIVLSTVLIIAFLNRKHGKHLIEDKLKILLSRKQ